MNSFCVLAVVTYPLLILPASVRAQEPAADARNSAFQDYLCLRWRKDFAGVIKAGPVEDGLKDTTTKITGRGNFHPREQIEKRMKDLLKNSPGLNVRQATEKQDLKAINAAYTEFVDILTELGEVRGKNIREYIARKQREAYMPPQPPPRPPAYVLPRNLFDRMNNEVKHVNYEWQMTLYRGAMADKTAAALSAQQASKNLKKLGDDIKETLKRADAKLAHEHDRLFPAVLADEACLQTYKGLGLLQDFTRTSVSSADSITGIEPHKKAVRIIYAVKNYFGDDCEASVIVYQNAKNEWLVSKLNEPGGFYALRLANVDQR